MSPPVRCHQQCIVMRFAAHLLETMETSSQEGSTVRSDEWSGVLAQRVKCANVTFGGLAAVKHSPVFILHMKASKEELLNR